MHSRIKKTLDQIQPIDRSLEPKILEHLNDLTKPPGSLGRLEEIASRYCLITRTVTPVLRKKRIFAFAGDHGVADEGVSAFPKPVTQQMVANMVNGGAAINVLSGHVGAELEVIDIGVDAQLPEMKGLTSRKIKQGTANMIEGPAMSIEETEQAIMVGIELAEKAGQEGIHLIGTGEMGIANTTPSTALFAALLPSPVEEVAGRGTGIDDEGLKKKIAVIKRAIEVNKAGLNSPLETLAALGGFEIAGICGLVLGAAALHIPVVVDGFISSAGAFVACKMNEAVKESLFFSHRSHEAGHSTFVRQFDVDPILDLKMRLGEGTGAALAMMVIESAIKIYNEMATFSSAGVSSKSE